LYSEHFASHPRDDDGLTSEYPYVCFGLFGIVSQSYVSVFLHNVSVLARRDCTGCSSICPLTSQIRTGGRVPGPVPSTESHGQVTHRRRRRRD